MATRSPSSKGMHHREVQPHVTSTCDVPITSSKVLIGSLGQELQSLDTVVEMLNRHVLLPTVRCKAKPPPN